MQATGGHSEACCNIPPIVSSGYQKKGDFETFDGRKTYVTGPAKEATKAIFIVMDIFGFFDQTVQGCDILASADDHNKYAVFMPDAFDGAPLDISLFPPDNDDKQQKVGAFFGKNSPPSFVPKAHATVKAIQEKYPNIKEWGVLGVSSAGPCFWSNGNKLTLRSLVLLGVQGHLAVPLVRRQPVQDCCRDPSSNGRPQGCREVSTAPRCDVTGRY